MLTRTKRKAAEALAEVAGLFIQKEADYQHASYAEPQPGVRSYRFEAPSGYECLACGSFGDTFVSLDRREVCKYFALDEEAVHEWQLFQRVAELAPAYAPVPGRLVRTVGRDLQQEKHKEVYVLHMQNAGPLLWDRRDLSSEELSLCLLQTIHFIALLGAEVQVEDIHPKNVCVRLSGAEIEVRWIDYGMWEVVPLMADPASRRRQRCYVMRSNMSQLLTVDAWRRQLARQEDDALSELLQECQDNASSMDWATVVLLAAESLLGLARSLGARLLQRKRGSDYSERVAHRTQALLGEIERTLAGIITLCRG
jgi:hypothetical protein